MAVAQRAEQCAARTRRVFDSVDVMLAIGFAAVVGSGTLWWFDQYRALQSGPEQWFQADLERVFSVLTDRYSGYHERSRIHPLFSLIATPPVYAIRRALGLDPHEAVRWWTTICASIWAALLYFACRSLTRARFDAVLIGCLVVSSAAAIVWLPVPETYALGSATMLLCVIAARWHEHQPLSDGALVATVAVSLAVTVTNMMAGLALLWRTRPRGRAVQLAVNAFFVVAMLQVVQHLVFPRARGMLDIRSEARFVLDPSSGGLGDRMRAALVHGVIIPEVQTPLEFDTKTPMLSVQRSAGATQSLAGVAATVSWIAMLTWGAAQAWRLRTRSTVLSVVMLTSLGQIALHLLYGDQTFLYSLHYVPMLVLVASSALTDGRWGPRVMVAVTTALCLLNNVAQAHAIVATLDRISVVPR